MTDPRKLARLQAVAEVAWRAHQGKLARLVRKEAAILSEIETLRAVATAPAPDTDGMDPAAISGAAARWQIWSSRAIAEKQAARAAVRAEATAVRAVSARHCGRHAVLEKLAATQAAGQRRQMS